ncbi:MAG: YgiT-type zinc finger protein [Bryobacteraceae bacterium]|nr:YgiT-type zinc finger protein [Bryobacteraceae bacterium]
MKCRVCGGSQERRVTDLPFKISDRTIVILKAPAVWQCLQCADTELEQTTMPRVEELLDSVSDAAELEVIRFAA